MQIQQIANHINYNNYQVKPYNTTKRLSSSSNTHQSLVSGMYAQPVFVSSVSFKASVKAQKSQKERTLEFIKNDNWEGIKHDIETGREYAFMEYDGSPIIVLAAKALSFGTVKFIKKYFEDGNNDYELDSKDALGQSAKSSVGWSRHVAERNGDTELFKKYDEMYKILTAEKISADKENRPEYTYSRKTYKGFSSVLNENGNTRLMQAWLDNDKEEFENLLYDPSTDINERDCTGRTILLALCDMPIYIQGDKEGYLYYMERVLQHEDTDVNAVEIGEYANKYDCALTKAARNFWNWRYFLPKLLEHPNVDTSLYDKFINYIYDKNIDIFNKEYLTEKKEVIDMVQNYKKGDDKRKGQISFANELTALDQLWTDEEKETIRTLLSKKNYKELVSLLITKSKEMNDVCGSIKQKMAELARKTEEAVRKNVTYQIRKEEKAKAEDKLQRKHSKLEEEYAKKEQALQTQNEKAKEELRTQQEDLKKQQGQLDKRKATLKKKEKHVKEQQENYDELTKTFQQLVVEEATEQVRALGLYNNDTENLPEDMDFEDKFIFVSRPIVEYKKKIKDINAKTPERLIEALQNDNKQITKDGLSFIERLLAAVESCNEHDLIDAIKAVKDEIGNINMKKAALMTAKVSLFSKKTLKDIIAETNLPRIKA